MLFRKLPEHAPVGRGRSSSQFPARARAQGVFETTSEIEAMMQARWTSRGKDGEVRGRVFASRCQSTRRPGLGTVIVWDWARPETTDKGFQAEPACGENLHLLQRSWSAPRCLQWRMVRSSCGTCKETVKWRRGANRSLCNFLNEGW